jgi:HAD superfamily hydrolase (TIGR01509 family)
LSRAKALATWGRDCDVEPEHTLISPFLNHSDLPRMSASKPRRLVIFDCDGVLVDSEILACGVQARAINAYGLPLSTDDIARRFLGMSARDMRRALERDLGRPLPEDHEARCGEELFALFRRELKPVAAIADVVEGLRAVAHPRCVASSSTPERIALALEVVGLAEAFGPHVFSSTQVPRGKPAPDLFLHAAMARGFAPADCLVVEDSVNGVTAARSAGMVAVGFLGGTHCPADHGDALSEAGAHRLCRNAPELAEALSALAGADLAIANTMPARLSRAPRGSRLRGRGGRR